MIRITPRIAIDERDIVENFIRASGPGGQNVNKLSTAVQIRFNTLGSSPLPNDVRERLARIARRRLTQDGILIITSRRHRTQEQNRREALARLVSLITQAATPRRARHPTKPTTASRLKRLDAKARKSTLKAQRRVMPPVD